MNTYEENLRESITQTLSTLSEDKTALQHEKLKAQFTLYHAKGALLAARDQFSRDQTHCEARRHTNRSVQRTCQQAQNLLDTLSFIQQGNEVMITNVGTTTTNLQASADAVMQLASIVGATLNLASATQYDTELFHQILAINDYLNQVANQACQLAADSMNVSSKCAECIAGSLADQGKEVQTRLTGLLSKTSEDLARSEQAVQSDRQQISDAAKAEFSARGTLLDATTRSKAMSNRVYETIGYANLDLTVDVLSAQQIKVHFLPFKPPFASNTRHGNSPVPQVRTYLALVPQSQTSQFTSDQAAQLFGKWDHQSALFIEVYPGENIVELRQDVYGSQIQPGSAYCAYLYLEPDAEHKRYLGNYTDHVSIASAPFIPLTSLPHAVYGGTSENPRRLLLALALEEQDSNALASEDAAPLFAGAARLEPYLEWLRRDEAKLSPSTLSSLNAVVGPFSEALKGILNALNNNDRRTFSATNREVQKLLREVHNWQDLSTLNKTQHTEISSLRSLLEELGTQIDHASTASLLPSPIGKRSQSQDKRLEVRCILVDQNVDANIAECIHRDKFPDFFNLAIAEQVAPANYSVAELLPKAPEGIDAPAALSGKECQWFAVNIEDDTTDNFGNPLLPSHRYIPFVLVTPQGAEADEWGSTLSAIDHVWQYA